MDSSIKSLSHRFFRALGWVVGYDEHFDDYYTQRYRTGITQRIMAYYRDQHSIAEEKVRKIRGEFYYKDLIWDNLLRILFAGSTEFFGFMEKSVGQELSYLY